MAVEPNTKRQPTPLPAYQLFVVYLLQFSEPVAASVILPFVNQFVRLTGVTDSDERKTGYYAGIIGSVFFMAEGITVYHWGAASDRFGRRSVLLLGPFGLAISLLSFGLSTKYWMLLLSRAVQGAFNGNIGVAKCVIAEISDQTNIGDAYSYMPMVWSVGTTIGPVIGGIFAEPAEQWPSVFGRSLFLRYHPYFLPCAVAAIIASISWIIAFIGLKESSPYVIAQQKKKRRDIQISKTPVNAATSLLDETIRDYGSREDAFIPELCNSKTSPPGFRTLLIPQVIRPLIVYMLQAFIDMGSQTLLPLMYSTSIPLGGLGLCAYCIGLILSGWGVVNAIIIFTTMGPLIRKYGARKVHIYSYALYFINTALYPLLTYLVQRSGSVDEKVWAVIALQLFSRLLNGMSYGTILIIIVDSAPSKDAVATTNGLAQAVGCLSRALSPAVASSLFSATLQHQLLGGAMVYAIFSGLALVGMGLAYTLPEKSDL